MEYQIDSYYNKQLRMTITDTDRYNSYSDRFFSLERYLKKDSHLKHLNLDWNTDSIGLFLAIYLQINSVFSF